MKIENIQHCGDQRLVIKIVVTMVITEILIVKFAMTYCPPQRDCRFYEGGSSCRNVNKLTKKFVV